MAGDSSTLARARAKEEEEVSIITTDDRTGPVVAVRCCTAQRATVDVAGPHKPQRGFANIDEAITRIINTICNIACVIFRLCNTVIRVK